MDLALTNTLLGRGEHVRPRRRLSLTCPSRCDRRSEYRAPVDSSYSRWPLLVAALAGIALMLAGHKYDTAWQQAVLVNLGSALLLFAALYLVQREVLERRVAAAEESAERQADELKSQVDEVRREVHDALDNLNEATSARLAVENDWDDAAITAVEAAPTAANAARLLARGRRLDAVSADGVRVALPSIWPRLRFSPLDELGNTRADAVTVRLEHVSGEVLETINWTSETPASELLADLAIILQRRDLYPGDDSYDPQAIMRAFISTVSVPLMAKAGRGRGVPSGIGPVIELCDGWALTTEGLEATSTSYSIDVARLHEPDWYNHMTEKTWVDKDEFWIALTAARAFYPRSDDYEAERDE